MGRLKQAAKQAVKSTFDLLGLEVRRRPTRAVRRVGADFSGQFQRYHVGCGGVLVEGFLNIDGEEAVVPGAPLADVPVRVGTNPETYFLKHELRSGVPATSNSLDFIYHSHFLEHLDDREGRTFLQECHRVLKPGKRMRVAVPDLNLWIGNYVSGNQAFFDWYRKTYLGDDARRYPTHGSVFMGMVYNWGHRMAYDFDTLSALLTQCGFDGVEVQDWGVSASLPEIRSLEGQSDRRFESLVIECSKKRAE